MSKKETEEEPIMNQEAVIYTHYQEQLASATIQPQPKNTETV